MPPPSSRRSDRPSARPRQGARPARRIATRLVALFWLLAVAHPTTADDANGASVTVTDDAGHALRLAAPARRIVSLAPHVMELLYEIGAGDRIVGADAYSDYPADAGRIPRVGGLSGIDVEAIVALHPDLVIAWRSGTSRKEIDALRRLHLPVFESEPQRLGDVASTLRRFGALTALEAAGATAAERFDARVAALRDRYARRPAVRVFYQVWNRPLMTVGGPQLITQVIELCGGRNVFAGLATLAPSVDVEAVIAADPQLIVTSAATDDHRADLALWSRWTGVSAVRNRRYLFLDPATITRQSSRLLVGAERLCDAIDAARPPR